MQHLAYGCEMMDTNGQRAKSLGKDRFGLVFQGRQRLGGIKTGGPTRNIGKGMRDRDEARPLGQIGDEIDCREKEG